MTTKNKENLKEAQNAQENIPQTSDANVSNEDFPNELREALWSVVSFDKSEASGLTYVEAEQKIAKLDAEGVSGLCIVTDETADRISNKTA